jgi:tRNA nucleotidyltransferase/poly(A) polymerase
MKLAIQATAEQVLKRFSQHADWLAVRGILETLQCSGHEAVIAGGSVRDALLNRNLKDFDIATSATPDEVESLFPHSVGVGKAFGVILVPLGPGRSVEIATFREDSDYSDGRRPDSIRFADAAADAARRDFTVNALFFDLAASRILDFVHGLEDLQRGVLRAVGDPVRRFNEDRLRTLRAVRFVSQLGFQLESETANAIREHQDPLGGVSRERVKEELDRWIEGDFFREGLTCMQDLGLLQVSLGAAALHLHPLHDELAKWIRSAQGDRDLQRAILYWPWAKRQSARELEQQGRDWRWGREFIEKLQWMRKSEAVFRTREAQDPEMNLKSWEQVFDGKLRAPEPWGERFELWTSPQAEFAAKVWDTLEGPDVLREQMLARRGLRLGHRPARLPRAADFPDLQGASLGAQLRESTRAILYWTKCD